MWTVIQIMAMVPDGFTDSGEAPMDIYVTNIIEISPQSVKRYVDAALRGTEVVSWRYQGYRLVEPFEPQWYQHVLRADCRLAYYS